MNRTLDKVKQRLSGLPCLTAPPAVDLVSLTHAKVMPMVNGLFTEDERPTIMTALEKSVVFLTPDSIESVLRTATWLSTSWDLANMYLLECQANPLSPDAPEIVGLSEETTCYLGLDYLRNWRDDGFEDYLVHEAAHIFHNCRRVTLGLSETSTQKCLLTIDFSKRELFAYACEAYSRLLVLADSPKDRRAALSKHAEGPLPGKDAMNQQEYLDILAQAVIAKNGWKRILQACTPATKSRLTAAA
ncbi:MAG: hypothetical protein COW02_14355 [Comamonadaceae bacterium CG12_big_fil_rev_8_21_14_0_65_59_15]|nr:MAG: hypothetical protein COW02_14355 [Comamonadaceae bacterium CG12_big_fil_rev_8_21_14_0_65_59_15]